MPESRIGIIEEKGAKKSERSDIGYHIEGDTIDSGKDRSEPGGYRISSNVHRFMPEIRMPAIDRPYEKGESTTPSSEHRKYLVYPEKFSRQVSVYKIMNRLGNHSYEKSCRHKEGKSIPIRSDPFFCDERPETIEKRISEKNRRNTKNQEKRE